MIACECRNRRGYGPGSHANRAFRPVLREKKKSSETCEYNHTLLCVHGEYGMVITRNNHRLLYVHGEYQMAIDMCHLAKY